MTGSAQVGATPPVRRRPGTSGWAVFAFVLSVAVFCPPLSLISPLVGVMALMHVREVPGRGGRGLARAAIVIGLVATVFWLLVVLWVHGNIRQPILDGPGPPLRAAQNGDLITFRSAFDPAALRGVPDEEAGRFTAELTRRYGRLVSVASIEPPGGGAAAGRPLAGGRVDAWYRLTFENDEIETLAPFIVFEGGKWWRFRGRFAGFRLHDAGRGDLVYPPALP